MTTSTATAVYNDLQARTPMVDVRTGVLSGQVWQRFFQNLSAQLQNLQAVANNAFGTNVFTLANQPALGTTDEGYVGFVSDYAHLVYWNGSAWIFLDEPGGRLDFRISDPGTGYQLCDGSITTVLTVGATLGSTSVTTPDLNTTAAYLKSAASYSGTVNAASGTTDDGATGTGTTGTGTTGTGTTGTGTTGTGTTGTGVTGTGDFTGQPTATVVVQSGSGATVAGQTHTHPIPALDVPGLHIPGLSIPGLSIPGLSIPGLSVPSLTVAGLGVGTLDLAHLGVPAYLRR